MFHSQLNLLTAEEAAAYLRLHVKSIYRLAREEKIPGRKIGGSWRFHQESLEQWLTKEKDVSPIVLQREAAILDGKIYPGRKMKNAYFKK